MNEEPCKKTLSDWLFLDANYKHTIDILAHESKNVFNHYLFCCNIFNDYRRTIYEKLLTIKTNDINQSILDELEVYFKIRSSCFNIIKNNSEIIYKHITKCDPPINNLSFNVYLEYYKTDCLHLIGIQSHEKYNTFVYDDIIYNILRSRYFYNYYKLKSELINHKKPTSLAVADYFIEHVKSNKTIFDTLNFHELLKEKYKDSLTTERNLLRRFAYKML